MGTPGPTTGKPTASPTLGPSASPTSSLPSASPSKAPSLSPTASNDPNGAAQDDDPTKGEVNGGDDDSSSGVIALLCTLGGLAVIASAVLFARVQKRRRLAEIEKLADESRFGGAAGAFEMSEHLSFYTKNPLASPKQVDAYNPAENYSARTMSIA